MKIILKYNIYLFIYIGLFLYGVIFSVKYLHKLDPSFSILVQEKSAFNIRDVDLLTGEKVSQEFVSKYDNLGIIALRFRTYQRINEDILNFRLKEKDSQAWYYTANYKTDQFQDHQMFPFGFPVIENSRGKTYIFELESKTGSGSSFVSVDNLFPVLITKHKFNVNNFNLFSIQSYIYILQKTINIISSLPLFYPILFYFLPFAFFIIQNLNIVFFKKLKYHLIFLPLILLAFRTPFYFTQPDYWEITTFLIWSCYLFKNKLTPNISLVVAMAILPYVIFQIIESKPALAEGGAFWIFVFLLYATAHSLITSLLGMDQIVELSQYCSSLFWYHGKTFKFKIKL